MGLVVLQVPQTKRQCNIMKIYCKDQYIQMSSLFLKTLHGLASFYHSNLKSPFTPLNNSFCLLTGFLSVPWHKLTRYLHLQTTFYLTISPILCFSSFMDNCSVHLKCHRFFKNVEILHRISDHKRHMLIIIKILGFTYHYLLLQMTILFFHLWIALLCVNCHRKPLLHC